MIMDSNGEVGSCQEEVNACLDQHIYSPILLGVVMDEVRNNTTGEGRMTKAMLFPMCSLGRGQGYNYCLKLTSQPAACVLC